MILNYKTKFFKILLIQKTENKIFCNNQNKLVFKKKKYEKFKKFFNRFNFLFLKNNFNLCKFHSFESEYLIIRWISFKAWKLLKNKSFLLITHNQICLKNPKTSGSKFSKFLIEKNSKKSIIKKNPFIFSVHGQNSDLCQNEVKFFRFFFRISQKNKFK